MTVCETCGALGGMHKTSCKKPVMNEIGKPSVTAAKTLIFTIEAPCAFLNVNERPHYHQKAKLTKAWREATAEHAERFTTMNLRIPVRIVAHIHKPGNRRWDPNNLSATTKACVDGMVDAGLIPDDSWREVIGPDHRRGNSAPNAITFTITEVQP